MDQTLALIKPDAVERNLIGNIITVIENDGFIIKDMKLMKMTVPVAEKFLCLSSRKTLF